MNRKQFGTSKKNKQINEERYLNPTENVLKLNKYHQMENKQKKKSMSSKIRDTKRLIEHVKNNNVSGLVEAKQKDLKELNQLKRDKRKSRYVDLKYKNIKFYEIKRARKALKKLLNEKLQQETTGNGENEDIEKKIEEIKRKIIYIKYYPRGETYISILKEESLTEAAKKLQQQHLATTYERYNKHKQSVLSGPYNSKVDRTNAEDGDSKQFINDRFFFEDNNDGGEEDEADEEEEERHEERQVVDKKGNVLKKKK